MISPGVCFRSDILGGGGEFLSLTGNQSSRNSFLNHNRTYSCCRTIPFEIRRSLAAVLKLV